MLGVAVQRSTALDDAFHEKRRQAWKTQFAKAANQGHLARVAEQAGTDVVTQRQNLIDAWAALLVPQSGSGVDAERTRPTGAG